MLKFFSGLAILLYMGCQYASESSDLAANNDVSAVPARDLVLDGVQYKLVNNQPLSQGSMGKVYRVTVADGGKEGSNWVVKVPFLFGVERENNEEAFLKKSAAQLQDDYRLNRQLRDHSLSEIDVKYSSNRAVLFKTFIDRADEFGALAAYPPEKLPDGLSQSLGELLAGLSKSRLKILDLTGENIAFIEEVKKLQIFDGMLSRFKFPNEAAAMMHYLANFKMIFYMFTDTEVESFLMTVKASGVPLKDIFNKIKMTEDDFHRFGEQPRSKYLRFGCVE